ncbi:MAG TPA: hypothetical protein VIH00_04550, partial [Candidatus Limnocylindrales bacterium]
TLESLLLAMRTTPDDELGAWMLARGVALADEETLSQALHDVYCGIAADHPTPNAKDHAQALALIAALRKQMDGRPPA